MNSRKSVLVSCRVDAHAEINEDRDALDQRLSHFLWTAGFQPILVPNLPEAAEGIFSCVTVSGIVLSGGNDVGKRPERDQTEEFLLTAAGRMGLPVFGICRGLQMMTHAFGGSLKPVTGHVRSRHSLISASGDSGREVNSYHAFSPDRLSVGWRSLATAPDSAIEWAISADGLFQGIMWHPEREPEFHFEDLRIVREHFKI